MNKNKFVKTPPMDWNSYYYYDTTVNESQIKRNADFMAKNLKDMVGNMLLLIYNGMLIKMVQWVVNSAGFKPLAEYIHNLGLNFGIHIMRGIPRIAAHIHSKIKDIEATADMITNPSSIWDCNLDMYGVRNTNEGQAYYDSLIKLYSSFGVDFIKCDDFCNTNIYPDNQYSAKYEIEMLSKAIQKCGRSIVLSLSPGPALINKVWHYEKHANMWCITNDFWINRTYVALFNLSDEISITSVNLQKIESGIKLNNLYINKICIIINKAIVKELSPHTSNIYELV